MMTKSDNTAKWQEWDKLIHHLLEIKQKTWGIIIKHNSLNNHNNLLRSQSLKIKQSHILKLPN